MTIYIIDNGEQYSDHSISFVESSYPLSVMELVVELAYKKSWCPEAKIIGMADNIHWYEGRTCQVYEFLHAHELAQWLEGGALGEPYPEALKLPTDLVRTVLKHAYEYGCRRALQEPTSKYEERRAEQHAWLRALRDKLNLKTL